MSAENVQNLLKKLTSKKQKTNLILKGLQEVELWERTQDKFVAMLEEEYSVYRDVITPFIVAIFQVFIHKNIYRYGLKNIHCIILPWTRFFVTVQSYIYIFIKYFETQLHTDKGLKTKSTFTIFKKIISFVQGNGCM